jgi:hypothetical protein
MRKFFLMVSSFLLLAGCGAAAPVFENRVDAPWGSVGLPEGWIVASQDGYQLRLESQLETDTEVNFRHVRMPQDLEGWSKSFIESSGRNLVRSGTITISEKKFLRYDLTVQAGKETLGELLVLIPVDGKLLAIDALWKSKSVLGGVPEEIVQSIILGGK